MLGAIVFGLVIGMTQTQLDLGTASRITKSHHAGGKTLFIDPWLTNPVFEMAKRNWRRLKNVDLDSADARSWRSRWRDRLRSGRERGAKLIANVDLPAAVVSVLGYPGDQAGVDTSGHIDGQLTLLDGEVNVCFVPAFTTFELRRA